jgi:hypothetical protein
MTPSFDTEELVGIGAHENAVAVNERRRVHAPSEVHAVADLPGFGQAVQLASERRHQDGAVIEQRRRGLDGSPAVERPRDRRRGRPGERASIGMPRVEVEHARRSRAHLSFGCASRFALRGNGGILGAEHGR